ncbi:MAG: cobalamin-binding protein [Flavobacteriaceae bacterium]|nr:cobalamin-binding protein [Flavobacteriaceae bacterium]
MRVNDQLNREIELRRTPRRIVSLVPSQTELLVHLGLRDSLVGITKFCVHPKQLRKEITVVGGTKSVHYSKIKEVAPDIILCNKEENTAEMVSELGKIAPVWVSDINSYEESLEMIALVGQLFGKELEATGLISEIEGEKKEFVAFSEKLPRKKVAYLIWKDPFMAVGSHTFIDGMLKLNNFENIFAGSESRYPEIELEALKTADLVLLSTEPFPFKDEDAAQLEKVLKTEVRVVDGEYFSWYGSRMANAFRYFTKVRS